jgi:group I intron endonuclease
MERALLKYGYSNFTLEILEYCATKDVIQREQYYLDSLKPGYNIVKKAGSTLGYKHIEETLKKIRDFIISDLAMAKKKLYTKNATASRRLAIWVKNIETEEVK